MTKLKNSTEQAANTARPNEQAVFDYMQEQAENLLDFCARNGVTLENPGFFVNPEIGYVYIAATRKGNNYEKGYILSKSKFQKGGWSRGIDFIKLGETDGE